MTTAPPGVGGRDPMWSFADISAEYEVPLPTVKEWGRAGVFGSHQRLAHWNSSVGRPARIYPASNVRAGLVKTGRMDPDTGKIIKRGRGRTFPQRELRTASGVLLHGIPGVARKFGVREETARMWAWKGNPKSCTPPFPDPDEWVDHGGNLLKEPVVRRRGASVFPLWREDTLLTWGQKKNHFGHPRLTMDGQPNPGGIEARGGKVPAKIAA